MCYNEKTERKGAARCRDIIVFWCIARIEEEILFCKRLNDPYEGMYNLVGGKIEPGEDGFHAAYRELFEETGISREDVTLYHMMDFTYYNQNCFVEVYTGVLQADVELRPEKHPLHWISAEENFFDLEKYAGEGNIGHMVVQAERFGSGIAK